MKGIILSPYTKELYSNRRLIAEALMRNIAIELVNPYNHSWQLTSNLPQADWLLIRSSGVFYDDIDLFHARSWQIKYQQPVVNPASLLPLFRDRPWHYLWALENKLSPIPTFFPRKNDWMENLNMFMCNHLSQSRWVTKTWRGNGSRGVRLLENKQSTLEWASQMMTQSDQKYVLQPWIDIIQEYRYFFVGDRIWTVVKNSSDDSQGLLRFSGKSAQFSLPAPKLPEALQALAQKARLASGLDYGAIDIACTRSQDFHLMEVNSMPGFEKLEQITGINLAGEIVEYLMNKN